MGLLIWLLIPVALLAAVVLCFIIDSTMLFGFFPSFALSGIESDIRANWGALGDVMGGFLNPILTFISIVLLIKTVTLSKKTVEFSERQTIYNIFYNHFPIFDDALKKFDNYIGCEAEELIEKGYVKQIKKACSTEKLRSIFQNNTVVKVEREAFVYFVRELRNILVFCNKDENLLFVIFGRLRPEIKVIIIYYSAFSDWDEAKEIKEIISNSETLSSIYKQSLMHDKNNDVYRKAVMEVID